MQLYIIYNIYSRFITRYFNGYTIKINYIIISIVIAKLIYKEILYNIIMRNNTSILRSNYNLNIDFIKDILSPVEHSISLEILYVHFMVILILFIIVISIISVIYFYINIIIIFNKDYFLNKITNKYLLMYIKYIVLIRKVDIFVIGFIILSILYFYCLCITLFNSASYYIIKFGYYNAINR